MHILTVARYFPVLGQPYQIAVYKVFSRRTVSACYLGIVIVGCFIFATAANWLFHMVTANYNAAIERNVQSQQAEEQNEVELSYGIVIDCGSSGSRVFVYCWPPHNGKPHQLLNIQLLRDNNGNPAVMKTEPGNIYCITLCVVTQLILLKLKTDRNQ